mmetsp:Transcript_16618/g.50519  ORF Transcript_16618/g.50519 Transcript_16618/m.50519 type:complete len:261 (-) Transcript_16618:45-827(-)
MARVGRSLEKALAATGNFSRSQAAKLISENRVTLNGHVCRRPSVRVTASADAVAVDGKVIALAEATARLFRFHKPAGFITTRSDPLGRPTIFSILPPGLPPVKTIGRLDMATEGLLLLTTSGPLARLLELPSTGMKRTYRALVATGPERRITDAMISSLGEGLKLADGTCFRPILAKGLSLDERQGGKGYQWVHMTLTEGKKHEVRRAWSHFGFSVTRLVRESFGPFELGDLQPRQAVEIKGSAVEALMNQLDRAHPHAC